MMNVGGVASYSVDCVRMHVWLCGGLDWVRVECMLSVSSVVVSVV